MFELTTEPIAEIQANDGILFDVGSLISYLHQLTDPRQVRGIRYSLVSLMVLLILAKLGGEDGIKGMSEWVKLRATHLAHLLHLSRVSMPHQTTYERVLDALDEVEVAQVIGAFFAQAQEANVTISIDGKVLGGTIPVGESQGTHRLAAYVLERGVVLMQIEVESKANEIVPAPCLLEYLDLSGCGVTGDALFTQSDLGVQIVEAGGHFVFPVKANQKTLQQAIADGFMPARVAQAHQPIALAEAFVETTSSGHGRIEKRYLTVSSALND